MSSEGACPDRAERRGRDASSREARSRHAACSPRSVVQARRFLAAAALVVAVASGCSSPSGGPFSDLAGAGEGSGDAPASGAGATTASESDAGAAAAAGQGGDGDGALDDAGAVPLKPLVACPKSGDGAIDPPGKCFAVTPASLGASAAGENATYPSYALTPGPSAARRDQLVLYFNGSGGHPATQIASPTVSFYGTAASMGYAVIGLSYVSERTMAGMCSSNDGCYTPTHESILRGVAQPGAAAPVQGIRLDEGIATRLWLTLRYLAAKDAASGWGSFLVAGAPAGAPPEARVAWSKIVVSGHSQGGGHAVAIAKAFPVARVVQLSSACDSTAIGVPATWTKSTNGSWATDPSTFWGLAAATTFSASGRPVSGDTSCPTHAAVWKNLGMTSARADNDAATCGNTGNTHGASLFCVDNAPKWRAMLR